MALTADDIRAHKCELFATQASVEDAINYAQSMLGGDQAYVTTALMVFANTMLEHVAAEADLKELENGIS